VKDKQPDKEEESRRARDPMRMSRTRRHLCHCFLAAACCARCPPAIAAMIPIEHAADDDEPASPSCRQSCCSRITRSASPSLFTSPAAL